MVLKPNPIVSCQETVAGMPRGGWNDPNLQHKAGQHNPKPHRNNQRLITEKQFAAEEVFHKIAPHNSLVYDPTARIYFK